MCYMIAIERGEDPNQTSDPGTGPELISREAASNLMNARVAVANILPVDHVWDAVTEITSNGGTVKWDDKTLIIEPTTYEALIEASGWEPHDYAYIDGKRLSERGKFSIISAFTARYKRM